MTSHSYYHDTKEEFGCMNPSSVQIAGCNLPIARQAMGARHARSHYLNRKEEDAEGGASDWSEVVTR
ncbi:hypothetical protein AMTR_s00103p00141390 [Amborella trichopoda]|uniref:Uncharacterized protein n=1 Tax=Amborella trichopoda TaxID=13333 RepID=W1NZU2_AMBTC|nr:hypothetical protein AMTR_s00103p00141390 [Amborella trichopoda]